MKEGREKERDTKRERERERERGERERERERERVSSLLEKAMSPKINFILTNTKQTIFSFNPLSWLTLS